MAASTNSTFGWRLQRYRKRAGLTQQELADRSGYSVDYIGKLERDQRQVPSAAVDVFADILALGELDRRELQRARTSHDREVVEGSPLAGREAERTLLRRHLAGLEPSVLLLSGGPGMGKTRLLEEVIYRAAEQGLVVLAGGCSYRGSSTPLLDALSSFVRQQSVKRRETLLAGCGWLVRLLPELAELGLRLPDTGPASGQERRLAFHAVARLLANAGPESVLVLDDLQWADADTVELLAHLVGGQRRGLFPQRGAANGQVVPIRIVGAYRGNEVGPRHPLANLVADLLRTGQVRQVVLAPLDDAAAEEMLGALLEADEADLGRIVARAGGVPLYLVGLAQAVRDGAQAEELPSDLRQMLRQRVAALPEQGRVVLGAAAVIGRQAPLEVLQAVTLLGDEELLAALDALLAAAILVEEGEESYCFGHDLIREVVEADLGAARRLVLHRRVGLALEALLPAVASEHLLTSIAYHHAAGRNPEKAIEYLGRAADAAQARHAYAAAAERYGDLAQRLEALGRHAASGRALIRRGAVLTTAGRYQEALTDLERAAPRLTGDREGEAEMYLALSNIADIHAALGQSHLVRGCLERALAVAEQIDDPMLVTEVLDSLAWDALTTGDWSAARRYPQQAQATPGPVGTPHTGIILGILHGAIHLYRGDWEEAKRFLEEALASASQYQSRRGQRGIQHKLAILDLAMGNPAGALARLRSVIDEDDLTDDATRGQLAELAEAYLGVGHIGRAEEILVPAIAGRTKEKDRFALVELQRVYGMVLTRQERWAEAEHVFQEAAVLAQRMPYPYLEGRIRYEDAMLLAQQGKREQARAQLEIARAIFERLGAQKVLERAEQALLGSDHLTAPVGVSCR